MEKGRNGINIILWQDGAHVKPFYKHYIITRVLSNYIIPRVLSNYIIPRVLSLHHP